MLKKIFLAIIITILVAPVVTFNFTQNEKSDIDNKVLTALPLGNPAVTNMTQSMTNYVSDRIGFRTQAINAYTNLNDKIFNQMVHPAYTYGKNGYVFFKMPNNEVNYAWIDEFTIFLSKIQAYCKERKVPFLYCLNPSKISVYKQYLPKGYNYKNESTKYLVKKLKEHKINYIDNTEMLIEKSKKEQVFNIKYDAGHWNDLGAFYGTNEILKKLHEDFPIVNENKLEDFNITNELQTTLHVSEFGIHEYVPNFENKSKNNVSQVAGYEALKLNKKHPMFSYFKNEKAEQGMPKVLVFQGSYLNSRYKYFESNFKEYIAVHNYENVINFDYYFNIFKPESVVFESTEYATGQSYFDYDKLYNAKFNPYLDLDKYDYENKDEIVEFSIKEQNEISEISIADSYNFINNKQIKYAYLICGNQEFDIDLDALKVTIPSIIYKQGDSSIVTVDEENKLYKFSNLELIKQE